MAVAFHAAGEIYARMCIGKFEEVASRLRKGKIKSKDLPTINEAFSIIQKMLEDVAKQQGMTYKEYVEHMRRKEKEEAEAEELRQKQQNEETRPEPKPDDKAEGTSSDTGSNENPENPEKPQGENPTPASSPKTKDGRKKGKGGKRKGSGKKAIAAISTSTTTLPIVGIGHGDPCPSCHSGGMYPIDPGIIGRIQVQATFVYEQIHVEKSRCNQCGQTISAEIPPGISEDHVRCASFGTAATLLVMRHHLAIPNLRLEKLNSWMGTPLADSRQWDIMNCAADRLYPIYKSLLHYAAEADVQVLDDGWCRIICVHRAIREEIKVASALGLRKEDLRTGVNTTAILGYMDDNVACVYISGRKHQGENAHTLDLLRQNSAAVVRMTDAASKATSTRLFPNPDPRGFVLAQGGKILVDSRVFAVYCLAHLRNKVEEIKAHAPELCEYILSRIKAIYHIDDEATSAGFTPMERMALHQEKSASLVQELKARIDSELAAKKWFPKEPVAVALTYAQTNLESCTAFLHIPGCPLDSNAAERAIIPVVRHRLSSLAFQTERGAFVGDISMTLAGSAVLAKKNPIDYLSKCLEFSQDVEANPQEWLPWNYETRWQNLKNLRTAQRESLPQKGFQIVHRKRTEPSIEPVPPSQIPKPESAQFVN
jgi:transposase